LKGKATGAAKFFVNLPLLTEFQDKLLPEAEMEKGQAYHRKPVGALAATLKANPKSKLPPH